ncbi:MAG: hypothetical protein CMP48_03425 [Rickettsiales bacterium]|nr:hypothetical protein [Rickettsiales bacterium]
MKLLPSSLILLLLITITHCSSEKEGDLLPDCSQTSLSLEIVETINAKCETPGEVELLGSGGQGGYSYGLDGNTFQSSPTFDGLSAGGYTFYVKDIAGCVVSVPGTIGADDGSVVGAVVSSLASGCGGDQGAITLTASGGDENYQYSVDGGDFASSSTIEGLESGSHTFIVKDGSGCSDDGTFDILTGTSLANEVMPIIEANCAVNGCHGTSQQPVLNTKAAVMASASRIGVRTSAGTMPPAGRTPLTQEQIDQIACWANDGAPDN